MNNIPDWARKYKTKGVYIRNVGNSYYAYRTRSKWDKENKKTKTLPPEYMGVVTRNGIVRKGDVTGIRSDYEYGNIALLYGRAEKTILPVLKEVFPYLYGRIINYVMLREIQPLPMKSIRYLYEKTYLSRISDESMASSSISGMLSSLPWDQSVRVMRKLTEKGEYVLIDSTAVFSGSENASFLESGHNSKCKRRSRFVQNQPAITQRAFIFPRSLS